MEDKKNEKNLESNSKQIEEALESKTKNASPKNNLPDTDRLPILVNRKIKKTISTEQQENLDRLQKESFLKIMPVKNTVLFPHNVMPFTAGREWTSESVDRAARIGGTIGILAYKTHEKDLPLSEQMYTVGTEAKILKILRFPDGTNGAIVQGLRRFRVVDFDTLESNSLNAHVEFFDETKDSNSGDINYVALGKSLKLLVQKAISLSPQVPNEASLFIENVNDPSYLADLIVPYLSIDFEQRQELLEIESSHDRLKQIHFLLTREIEVLEISKKFNQDVKDEVSKQQRKYFLKEQMKLMQKELTEIEGKSSPANEVNELSEKLAKSKMSKEAREITEREIDRLNMMQPGSPEYMVSHTYVNWMLDLPWETYTQPETIDLTASAKILDSDHYGMEKVKKRVLEFLAVTALKQSLKGPILLFVGPPGVGKTSLGKSIAKALNRKFIRIALGGVRDESEIRGHRRTYIGSMPGKIIDSLKKAGSMDPVILLDEIDKLSNDGRGDPSSALLEVLDPEQNNHFTDHYLNVSVDLSRVFFICTANNFHTIPAPLRDRMEVVELSSYTLYEKEHIAFDHLLPQVIEEHGLKNIAKVKIQSETMKGLIQQYTREAGVRQLKRELSSVMRSLAKNYVEKGFTPNNTHEIENRNLGLQDIHTILGPEIFSDKKRSQSLPVGVSTGLAWTPNGGDVLFIETATHKGSGKLSLTGQLGDVMKESVHTAFSYIKSHAKECNVPTNSYKNTDIHIHFPEGAVKKDGPSAGVASFLALVSQFSGKSLNSNLAMTGEISLRGDVMKVGGVKEKLLAAHRFGIENILIPQENARDLEDIPKNVLSELNVVPVSNLSQVLSFTFGKQKNQLKTRKKTNT